MTETTAIAITEDDDAAMMATSWARLTPEQRVMLKQASGTSNMSDGQAALFHEIARSAGLSILRRQIYCLPLGGKSVIIIGIDGFRGIAARSGEHVGTTDPVHTYAEEDTAQRFPMTSTITVRRNRGGVVGEYTATARFREYAKFSNGKPTGNWASMPHTMLDKCAEALALRKAFTETLGGVYERAEVDARAAARAQQVRPASAKELLAAPAEPTTDDAIDVDGYEDHDPTDKDAP